MRKKITNKQLLKIWDARLARRKKKLAKLLSANKTKNNQIEKVEQQVVVAKHKVEVLKKKLGGKKLKVHKPKLQVNRIKRGNVHGRIYAKVIVLHSTESHDRPGVGDVEGVLTYLEDTPESLGVHFVVDGEGNLGQGGRINQLMYHAKGANSFSLGIEQIGFAYHTYWNRVDRTPQIEEVAKLLAWLSQELDIPLRHSASHGIAMHSDFPLGGHTDPGPSYPMSRVLHLARKFKKTGW